MNAPSWESVPRPPAQQGRGRSALIPQHFHIFTLLVSAHPWGWMEWRKRGRKFIIFWHRRDLLARSPGWIALSSLVLADTLSSLHKPAPLSVHYSIWGLMTTVPPPKDESLMWCGRWVGRPSPPATCTTSLCKRDSVRRGRGVKNPPALRPHSEHGRMEKFSPIFNLQVSAWSLGWVTSSWLQHTARLGGPDSVAFVFKGQSFLPLNNMRKEVAENKIWKQILGGKQIFSNMHFKVRIFLYFQFLERTKGESLLTF